MCADFIWSILNHITTNTVCHRDWLLMNRFDVISGFTAMWFAALLALICLSSARAHLTADEVALFQSQLTADGQERCGGFVEVTEHDEHYLIESNGLPDHHWQLVSWLFIPVRIKRPSFHIYESQKVVSWQYPINDASHLERCFYT